jgi:hypothetical protein
MCVSGMEGGHGEGVGGAQRPAPRRGGLRDIYEAIPISNGTPGMTRQL